MSWYALEKIEEALNETKDFLTPFELGIWSRLAVLVLLLGGGFNMGNIPTGSPPSDTGSTGSSADIAFSGADMTSSMHSGLMPQTGDMMTGAFSAASATAATAIIAAASIVVVLVVLSNIARFVFFQASMEKQVSLRKMFRQNFTNGLQYIGFSFLVALLMLAPLVTFLAGITLESSLGIGMLLLMIPYWIVLFIAVGFVNDFGLPLMISEKVNVIEAAKRALGLVIQQKGQAAVYFLTKIGIGITLGVISLAVLAVAFLALLIPFGILGVVAYLLTPLAGGIVAALGLLALFVVMLYIQVPLETYRHYFYLLNLEEFAELELVER